MKRRIQINRNIIWAEAFIDQLVKLGVRYACISPGSRSTPLALACANNPALHKFVHIDERSGGFFALGAAKSVGEPVILICTSGTAAAEFYPAIIEAYQQNVPLIVCTADRPPEMIGCGANQTINQNNIYANHIRWFFNAGLPEPIPERMRHIRALARRTYGEAMGVTKGPVHINFPFRKPFEPDSYTDTVAELVLEDGSSGIAPAFMKGKTMVIPTPESMHEIASVVTSHPRGLFIVGPGNFNREFAVNLGEVASLLAYPILADGASQMRFGSHDKSMVLTHYDSYLKIPSFVRRHKPELIIQFGGTVSSKGLELFLNEQEVLKIHVNPGGEWIDPSNVLRSAVQAEPAEFCKRLSAILRKQELIRSREGWYEGFENAERIASEVRREMIDCTESLFEGKILRVVFETIPDGSHVMVSNSMPIRDLDYFVSTLEKSLHIHTNRGASGIDGINSTALGIAATVQAPVYLITGDLAFYHDMNGLLTSKKYSIPITIVLINNNGGGIFELLPIAEHQGAFAEYFLTPHDIEFRPFVEGYGGIFHSVHSWDELRSRLSDRSTEHPLRVLEIRTNAKESTALRKLYWQKVEKALAVQ